MTMPRRERRAAGIVAASLVALSLVAGPAWGQPSPSAPDPPASSPEAPADDTNARFAEGLALFESGKHDEAAASWEQLLRDIGPARGWKLNYNLGLAYYAADRATLAVERFEAFVQRVAAETAALNEALEQRREDAAAKLGAIRASHGAVLLPPAPKVTVSVDDQPSRPVGFTAYLLPGRHRVLVIGAEGHQRVSSLEVLAGRQQTIDTRDPKPAPVSVPMPPPVVRPALPSSEEPPGFPTIVVAIGVGLTAAGFILPAVMYGRASDARTTADDLGAGHSGYPAAVDDFESARRTYRLSWALPGVIGAITAGIAVYGVIRVTTAEPGASPTAILLGPTGAALETRF
jgi:tetratricopeptide (TPR) repeat protein